MLVKSPKTERITGHAEGAPCADVDASLLSRQVAIAADGVHNICTALDSLSRAETDAIRRTHVRQLRVACIDLRNQALEAAASRDWASTQHLLGEMRLLCREIEDVRALAA